MYHKKLPRDVRCPLEYGLEVFGGKWKSRIICVLAEHKTLRNSEIKKQLVNVTDAVLAQNLNELVADGIIERTRYDEMPPRTEYSLTDKGVRLVPILQDICSWAGVFDREDYANSMPQCRKCDYYK